ncbi:hypothetical protein LCGC14_2861090, partial [marine sediment metagenome]
VIATGARPVRPGFMPADSPRVMTTDEAATAVDLPESVVIIGGGVIGCEFATIYAELGIRTLLVEMLDRLAGEMDEDSAEAIAASLADRGVEVLVGERVVAMSADAEGVIAELAGGRRIESACALVAVGRQANVEEVGLNEVAVELADGVIRVDDRCRTNVPGIYAVGDVAETRQFAHLAERMGIVAAENIMGIDLVDDRSVVPIGVYTHPEAASVGLPLAEAKERFGSARVFRYSYSNSPMGIACDRTAGQLKVIADPETGTIYGAVWIGPHATDMIQEMALAMRSGITMEQLWHTIHAHPTFQEAASVAADAWVAGAMRQERTGRGKA